MCKSLCEQDLESMPQAPQSDQEISCTQDGATTEMASPVAARACLLAGKTMGSHPDSPGIDQANNPPTLEIKTVEPLSKIEGKGKNYAKSST